MTGGQLTMGAKDRGAKDRGAKDRGANDRGANDRNPCPAVRACDGRGDSGVCCCEVYLQHQGVA